VFSHRNLIKAAVLSVETKSTEPSKRSRKRKLLIFLETPEISVILILLAVFSPPIEILHLITSFARKNVFPFPNNQSSILVLSGLW